MLPSIKRRQSKHYKTVETRDVTKRAYIYTETASHSNVTQTGWIVGGAPYMCVFQAFAVR